MLLNRLREQRQVSATVNGHTCESLETMPRRQAEEASPPILAPPAGAGASGPAAAGGLEQAGRTLAGV